MPCACYWPHTHLRPIPSGQYLTIPHRSELVCNANKKRNLALLENLTNAEFVAFVGNRIWTLIVNFRALSKLPYSSRDATNHDIKGVALLSIQSKPS